MDKDLFNSQYKRNIKAQELYHNGDIDGAIKLLEENIAENFEGNFPYDLLISIYSRQKRITDVVRVLEKAIYVFTEVVYINRGDRQKKLDKYLQSLKKYK